MKQAKEKFKDDNLQMNKELPAGLITAICVRYRVGLSLRPPLRSSDFPPSDCSRTKTLLAETVKESEPAQPRGPDVSLACRELFRAVDEKKLTKSSGMAYGTRVSYEDVFAYIDSNGLMQAEGS